ncbi:MAG: hypothetical protein JKY53_13335 [Flavobacteriales bacterium]|nr:hypothetical protein [Flavobacteriales bacterium]
MVIEYADLKVEEYVGRASFQVSYDFSTNPGPSFVSVSSASVVNTLQEFGGAFVPGNNANEGRNLGMLGMGSRVDIVPNTLGLKTEVVVSGWVYILGSYDLGATNLKYKTGWDAVRCTFSIVVIGQ